MEDEATKPLTANLNKRHTFNDRLWNQLRLSKRKPKAESFVSYCSNNEDSCPDDNYISAPTNFERRDLNADVSLTHISIQECPFEVTGYGNLILKDEFKLKKTKKEETHSISV
ncbi:hypothetical protein NQ314_018856 [Rhamnusium bicolor]|uniref:Uncharacterized protein n=1 Tax=Rhamnusium bicolor TaxID=1586634 RepID=A0AAV8WS21_9CUCU|nr:hypothetical protein NQ314_018856 [Rhamnusium bicolor]